jgi:3,5-dioxohexanoate:acetyl-CoA acetone transferase
MSRRPDRVIISCALTGGIHTPTMSPALPVTPDMLAEQGIAAARAGAAILHVHARDPRDGRPTPDPEAYLAFLPRLKAGCDAVINITTGGGMNMTVDDRLKAPALLRPEMCSLNMGSMNFGIFQLADRYQSWKYDWEEPYLRATEDHVFKNTFRDIARIISVLGEGHGCRFEHECYDVGHLYNLAHIVDRRLIKPPFFVQLIFGVLGGIGPDIANLMFMKQTADRLFGTDYLWSVLAAGRWQMPFAAQSVLLGGSVRVGLEDSLFIDRGKLASSNAEQVSKVRTIVEALGHEIATPAEVRQSLGLKGADAVAF